MGEATYNRLTIIQDLMENKEYVQCNDALNVAIFIDDQCNSQSAPLKLH